MSTLGITTVPGFLTEKLIRVLQSALSGSTGAPFAASRLSHCNVQKRALTYPTQTRLLRMTSQFCSRRSGLPSQVDFPFLRTSGYADLFYQIVKTSDTEGPLTHLNAFVCCLHLYSVSRVFSCLFTANQATLLRAPNDTRWGLGYLTQFLPDSQPLPLWPSGGITKEAPLRCSWQSLDLSAL